MMPGGGRQPYEPQRLESPKRMREVPQYLRTLLGGFFKRYAYIVKLVWRTGPWILLMLSFIALFRGVAPVLGALISKNILNALQKAIALGTLSEADFWHSDVFYLLIFLFVYRLITQVVNEVNRAMNRMAGELVVKQVKTQIMEKSKELDVASFDDAAFYERMENANREAGHRPLSIITETFGIISTLIELISYLVILLAVPRLSWATLVIIVVSIPSAVINFVYRRKNFQYMRYRSKDRRQMDYYSGLLVNKDMVKEVRIFDLADTFIGRYTQVFRNYFRGLRGLIFSESAWHIAITVISSVTNLLFYALIAVQVFTGSIMLGDYTLFTGAIASVANCIHSLIFSSGSIYEGTLFIDNLIAFMDEPVRVKPRLAEPLKVPQNIGHTIAFSHVSFRYPGAETDVIRDVNFTIAPGETLALVGLNGAGKTTLIKLLTRLYDPTEGQILLDGKDLRDYDLNSLYGTFGIIFQDFGRYAVSVEENIRYGDIHKKTGMEAVRSAAHQSAAGDYIEQLPEGYDTPLMRIFEPNGRELSVGQWQKIAVARAFYADSDILILDEPTASLDPMAEQEIFNQFDALRSKKTTIFVSHRLSSATIANRIIVLENGRLIEMGSHRELMAQQGKYYELFTTQAKRYIETAE